MFVIKKQELRSGRHCVFSLHAHLVFTTKYRKRVFKKKHIEHMQEIFNSVCKNYEVELIEFDGESDHVHLLVNFPPKVSISKLVNSLKGVSSRLLRKSHPDLIDRYWKGVLWSRSYFAGSVGGAPISVLRQYIENQQTPE